MFQRKKPIRLLKWALILLLLFEIVPWRPQERALLPRATRLTEISGAFPYYWWLSDSDVMVFRDPERKDWTLLRHSLKTGTTAPLDALTRLFRDSGGDPDSIQVSPDGKWMLWTGLKDGIQVATVDGARHWQEKSDGKCKVRWHPDSRRWIEVVETDEMFSHAILHSVDRPRVGVGKPIFPAIPSADDMVNARRMALTEDEHLLVCYWNETTGDLNPIARIRAVTFNANPGNINKIVLPIPRVSRYGELIFHPPAGRLAWVLEFERPWSLMGLFGLSLSTGLWVTDMNGAVTHDLGSLPTTRFGRRGSGPYNVQWTPDGTRLSFVFDDALWSVPLE